MITHDQLVFILNRVYPQLAHGQDYLVGHPMDPEAREQSGEPFLLAWPETVAQPDIAALIASYPNYESDWLAIRAREDRNSRLRKSDWTQTGDAPLSNAGNWKTYRQALRDVPQQTGFPGTINWPAEPAGLEQ
jgi:hypothetical protein